MLPLIPALVWGGTLVLGGYGTVQGVRGWLTKEEAEGIYRQLNARHGTLVRREKALQDREGRWIASNGRLATKAEKLFQDYAELATLIDREIQRIYGPQRHAYQAGASRRVEPGAQREGGRQRVGKAVKNSAASVAAGAALRQGTLLAIRQFGTASTGTAIRTLTGAAAQRATLSAAGGGAVAAGGGGIAAGVAALNVLAVGGTIALFGQRYLSGQQKKLEEALVHQRKVEGELDAIEKELSLASAKLVAEEQRTAEGHQLYRSLVVTLRRIREAVADDDMQTAVRTLEFAQIDLERLASMIRASAKALEA